jgi:L-lactate utilization protein LutB
MTSVFLLEPSAVPKRRQWAETVSERKRADLALEREEAERRLKEIRSYTVANLESLTERLRSVLGQMADVHVDLAENVPQAVAYIGRVCGPTRSLAVNKSAAVNKELAPALSRAGFEISESYFLQYPAFENRFQQHWQLPPLGFDLLDLSLSTPVDMNRLREWTLTHVGARDTVAVLGVGAASATDGSLYFFQHGRNIADIFQQARKVILVVSLDKVTSGAEEALFQTRCMALFGADSVLLDLQPKENVGPAIDELSMLPREEASTELHVLLLDNGRRRILGTPYRELLTCINCRACIKQCPTYNHFAGPYRWSPKEYVYFFAQGRNHSLDLCIQCGLCRRRCPIDIDIPGLIAFSRSRKRWSVLDQVMANLETLMRLSSTAPLFANKAATSRALRHLAHRTVGLSEERQLPRLPRGSFERWFQGKVE